MASELVATPPDAAEQVAALPRRTAHAVFALLETQRQDGYGPFLASEVVPQEVNSNGRK